MSDFTTIERDRELQRARQMTVSAGVGGVSAVQLYQQAHDLLVYYFPSQPEVLWTFLLSVATFALAGGFGNIIRRLEL